MARAIRSLMAAALLASAASGAQAQVVISQIYGGGGNSNATYTNDFIELFNAGSTAQSLNGLSVQYASAAGTSWSNLTTLPNVTLQPGRYLLIQESSGGATGVPLPTADVPNGSINLSAGSGKVALVNGTAPIASGTTCPSGAAILDFVAYGSASCPSPTGTVLTSSTAAIRKNGGCTHSGNNASDFDSGTPTPRNNFDAANLCAGGGAANPVAAGLAAPATVGAGNSTTLTINVTAATGPVSTFTLDGTTSAKVQADLSAIGGANPQAFSCGAPDASGNLSCTYTAMVSAGTTAGAKSLPITVVDDQNRSAAAASIALTVVASVSIMEIQGHGTTSPYAGAATQPGSTQLGAQVITPKNAADSAHWNIVTAINASKGFFMQDASGDGDLTTSDGIYVFTGGTPKYGNGTPIAVGDAVQVTGSVQEFSGTTEFGGTLTITKLGTGAVPAPFDLNAHPPTDANDSGVCVGGLSTINPVTDSFQASNFACLDGMLVQFSNATVAAATGGSGGGGNAPDSPQYFYATLATQRSLRTPGIEPGDPGYANFGGASLDLPVFTGHPNIFEVYFNSLGVHAADLPNGGIYGVGQQVSVSAGVVQGFQFTDKNAAFAPTSPVFYEIYPLSAQAVSVSGTALTLPTAVPDAVPGTLTIGTQNGLHFFNATNDGQDSTAYFDACLATPQQVQGNLPGLDTPLAPGDNDTCPTAAQYATRLSKMSLQIRTVLKAPVVQVLQEIESLSVLTDIADKIHADDATLAYHPYLFTGNDPQGINIGILARDGVTVNSVSQLAKTATTTACSGG
ncbi:MAG TPA: lamin tail domain-containing protein, partial [Rudaea sp.]